MNGVRPIGSDDNLLGVANDKKWRVFQRYRIVEELPVGCLKISTWSLALPTEVFLFPNVGPPLAASRFCGSYFEAVKSTLRISFYRCLFPQQPTQVLEMRICRLPLSESGPFPFINKIIGRHGPSQDPKTYLGQAFSIKDNFGKLGVDFHLTAEERSTRALAKSPNRVTNISAPKRARRTALHTFSDIPDVRGCTRSAPHVCSRSNSVSSR